ncbi:hypothetical protein F511_32284 [Dorcoceras hygrometricum]|uniref:Uncharacterized protein n=1 Tax=Dorcoceras hygrometricum TaxID=472368 RepID=A0A2Z7A4B4_9LAMI|nr:hypothetical protein F511_32284 [Dorcoceras hygrometricum]
MRDGYVGLPCLVVVLVEDCDARASGDSALSFPLCAEWLATTVHWLGVDVSAKGGRVGETQVLQLVVVLTQLVVPQESTRPDKVSSSRPPPDNQNRGSGNTGDGGDTVRPTDIPQRDIDIAHRNILERLMSADRARERERRTVGLFGGIQQMEEFSRSVVGLFSAVGIFRAYWTSAKIQSLEFALLIQQMATVKYQQTVVYFNNQRSSADRHSNQQMATVFS